MPVRRRLRTLLASSAAAAVAVAPAAAQESPLPPDPAIAQYVETVPTSSGAKARTGTKNLKGAPTDVASAAVASAAAEETIPMQLLWLAGALAMLTAVALVFGAARGRRRRE